MGKKISVHIFPLVCCWEPVNSEKSKMRGLDWRLLLKPANESPNWQYTVLLLISQTKRQRLWQVKWFVTLSSVYLSNQGPDHIDPLNNFFFLLFYINIFLCIVTWYIYRWASSHGHQFIRYISFYLYWFCRLHMPFHINWFLCHPVSGSLLP